MKKTTRRAQKKVSDRLKEEAKRNPAEKQDTGEPSAPGAVDQGKPEGESVQEPGRGSPGPESEEF